MINEFLKPLEPMTVQNFISRLEVDKLSQHDKIIKISQAVSDISWGESRTTEEVLTRGYGTCTGKHKLLQDCFDLENIKYQPVVVTFNWNEQGLNLPQNLKDILKQGSWPHGHNFVHLTDENIDIDVTWNSKLNKFGFKTLTENWDGNSSFVGVKNIIQRWDNVSIDQMKENLIGSLDEKTRERRKIFLDGFIEWVESVNFSKEVKL